MNFVVWRVSAPGFNVDAFVNKYRLRPESVWREGDKQRAGGKQLSSGFNLTILDSVTKSKLNQELLRYLAQQVDAFEELKDRAVSQEIDIGLTVGDSNQFTASVNVEPMLLSRLSGLGVELVVSAYPALEE